MYRHDGTNLLLGMYQHEMASLLPVLDKSGTLERPDYLAGSQRREFGRESSENRYRNGDPSLERRPFLRNCLPVTRQAFQV
jgi:hypothetical protein